MKKLSSILMLFGLFLATLTITGCATDPVSPSGLPMLKLGSDFQMPAPGKTKVVFLRPSHYAYAFDFGVHDGDRLIGNASSASCFVYDCDPGHHVFSASMDNLSFLDADLLPDRIYYVQIQAVMGIWTPGVELDALHPGCPDINWNKLPRIVSKLEKTVITPKAVAGDVPKITSYMERLKSYQDKGKNGGKILPEYGQTTPLSTD